MFKVFCKKRKKEWFYTIRLISAITIKTTGAAIDIFFSNGLIWKLGIVTLCSFRYIIGTITRAIAIVVESKCQNINGSA